MPVSSGTVEGVRQRNLIRLLRLVHLRGPLSRASLTEATGLNRSTIAGLVAELAAAGLVEEGPPDQAGRVGRPSPMVASHPSVVAIAANPEVDAIELGAVGFDQRLHARVRLPQEAVPTPEHTAEVIAQQITQWRSAELAEADIVGIGVAVPGLVRAADGLVRDAPHLEWIDAPVRDLVTEATGLETSVDNDATLGAIAEHLYGAAVGIDEVVYLNGGASGIGGGLIIRGIPVGGVGGYAGEFGQNRPGIAAAADQRAPEGVLEDEVSRNRLLAAAGLLHADDGELAEALTQTTGPDARAEVERQRRILATALANVVNVLNPAVVVLGGFLAILAEHDLPALEAAVRAQSMAACAEGMRIVPAALAEDRLLIGAAEAVFTDLIDTRLPDRLAPATPTPALTMSS